MVANYLCLTCFLLIKKMKIFICRKRHFLKNAYHNSIPFSLSVLHEKLAKLTDIHAGDQLILWMDKELCSVIDSHQSMVTMPVCIAKSQLFLVSRSCMDNYGLKLLEIRKLKYQLPRFGKRES